MVDFRAELAALVAAYDEHGGKWPQHHEDALWQAVEHARAVLSESEAASAVEAAIAAGQAVEAAIAAGQPVMQPSGTVIADPAWFASLIPIRAADRLELERQAAAAPVARLPEDAQMIEPANRTILVPVPAPISVSERLPEKAEMTDDDEVWVEYPGGEYPLGNTGDYDWEPHKWILSPIAKFTIRENRRWLPAHALPLPERDQ